MNNNTGIMIGLILIAIGIVFSSLSSDVFVNTNPMTTQSQSLLIEDYFNSCAHNSPGDDCYVVRKFGESSNIGNIIVPVTNGEVYQTPRNLTTLQIVSDNVNDNVLGIGARTIKITGLSTNWTRTEETIEMNGTTPVILANQYYRVYRVSIMDSGTYANQTAGSHQGNIQLTGTVGSELWALISLNGIALGQSEIGVYTIPAGYHGHLGTIFIHNNGNKLGNIYMMVRENASKVTAPYNSMKVRSQVKGIQGSEVFTPKAISEAIPSTSDIGFMANTDTGTTEMSVVFEILLMKNP